MPDPAGKVSELPAGCQNLVSMARLSAIDSSRFWLSGPVRAKAQRALQSRLDPACTHMDVQSDLVLGISQQWFTELTDRTRQPSSKVLIHFS